MEIKERRIDTRLGLFAKPRSECCHGEFYDGNFQWKLRPNGWRLGDGGFFLTTDDDSNPKILCSSATPINKAYIHQLSFKNWLGFSLPWILPVPVDIITFNYYPPAIDAFPKVSLMGDFPATAMMTPEGTSFSSVICIILHHFEFILHHYPLKNPMKIPWKDLHWIIYSEHLQNINSPRLRIIFPGNSHYSKEPWQSANSPDDHLIGKHRKK